MGYTLQLRQRITVLQNRYDVVRDENGRETALAYAEQKRLALREKISFFTDESRSQTAFTLSGRNIFELVGTFKPDPAWSAGAPNSMNQDTIIAIGSVSTVLNSPRSSMPSMTPPPKAQPTTVCTTATPTSQCPIQFFFVVMPFLL